MSDNLAKRWERVDVQYVLALHFDIRATVNRDEARP